MLLLVGEVMTALLPITPKPALTYEQMYFRVKLEIAKHVTDRKAPQIIFNLRELMAELEAERVAPWRDYIRARRATDKAAKDDGTSPQSEMAKVCSGKADAQIKAIEVAPVHGAAQIAEKE